MKTAISRRVVPIVIKEDKRGVDNIDEGKEQIYCCCCKTRSKYSCRRVGGRGGVARGDNSFHFSFFFVGVVFSVENGEYREEVSTEEDEGACVFLELYMYAQQTDGGAEDWVAGHKNSKSMTYM